MAFPPPPVTSPATRLKSEDLSDLRYLKVDHFPEARLRFYPRRSRKPCDSPEAKPFGFSAGCEAATTAVASLKRCVTASLAYPLAGHDAREHRDEDGVYTLASKASQAENTLRVEACGCGKACGKVLV